jgi:hypothetical protein
MLIVAALLVIGIALALFVMSTIVVVSSYSGNLQSASILDSPGSIRVHLASGKYALYENVEDAAFPLLPASVTVVGPSGVNHDRKRQREMVENGSTAVR